MSAKSLERFPTLLGRVVRWRMIIMNFAFFWPRASVAHDVSCMFHEQ
jgi:hypothetical protein